MSTKEYRVFWKRQGDGMFFCAELLEGPRALALCGEGYAEFGRIFFSPYTELTGERIYRQLGRLAEADPLDVYAALEAVGAEITGCTNFRATPEQVRGLFEMLGQIIDPHSVRVEEYRPAPKKESRNSAAEMDRIVYEEA